MAAHGTQVESFTDAGAHPVHRDSDVMVKGGAWTRGRSQAPPRDSDWQMGSKAGNQLPVESQSGVNCMVRTSDGERSGKVTLVITLVWERTEA